MKFPKIFLFSAVLAAGALSVSTSMMAQTMAPMPAMATDAGLIGKRHVGLAVSDENFSGSSSGDAYGAGASVNLPMLPNIDGQLAYGFKRISDSLSGLNESAVSGTVLIYNTEDYGKPYIAATVAQTWDRQKISGFKHSNNNLGFAVGVGCECQIAPMTALNGSVSYGDAFDGNGNKAVRYKLEFNRWCSPTVAVVVSAAYNQRKKAADSSAYSIGLRGMF